MVISSITMNWWASWPAAADAGSIGHGFFPPFLVRHSSLLLDIAGQFSKFI